MDLSTTPQTLNLCPFGKSTLYNYVAEGTFPEPVKIGNKKNVWLTSEIKAVINARIQGKDKQKIVEIVSKLKSVRGTPQHSKYISELMCETQSSELQQLNAGEWSGE